VKNYRAALLKDLPREIHQEIERHYGVIVATHNEVRALRDGAATSAGGRSSFVPKPSKPEVMGIFLSKSRYFPT
jgi:hypothetical protein